MIIWEEGPASLEGNLKDPVGSLHLIDVFLKNDSGEKARKKRKEPT